MTVVARERPLAPHETRSPAAVTTSRPLTLDAELSIVTRSGPRRVTRVRAGAGPLLDRVG